MIRSSTCLRQRRHALSESSVSFSPSLISPFSVALSPPLQLFSQASSQLNKVSVTLVSSLSSLIASSDLSALSTVLSTTQPASQQIIDMLSKINSSIVYVAIRLHEIDGEFVVFVSGGTSRRVLQAKSPLLSSIESTLESLSITCNAMKYRLSF